MFTWSDSLGFYSPSWYCILCTPTTFFMCTASSHRRSQHAGEKGELPTATQEMTGRTSPASSGQESHLVRTRSRPVRPSCFFLDAGKFQSVSLTQKIVVSADCYLFRFALTTPRQQLGLSPGQHVLVKKAGVTYTGMQEVVIRPYTPTSLVDTCGHFDLLVKVYRADLHPQHPEGGKLSQARPPRYPGNPASSRTVRRCFVRFVHLFPNNPVCNSTLAFKCLMYADA